MFYGNSYILDKRKIAYTYNITTASAAIPVTLVEVKEHLKIDADDATEDTYLTLLVNMATEYGEKYTGRDFINKTYTTFRDGFYDPLELRRSKVSSITSINYLVSNVFTLLASSVYSFTDVQDYPQIFLQDGQSWPEDIDTLPQAVKIIFISGYGAAATNIPAAIKMALLNHIAFLYENRGDCSGECNGVNLPANSKSLYDKYRIINIGSYERDPSYYRL